MLVGIDPGRAKCGVAVVDHRGQFVYGEVVPAEALVAALASLRGRFAVEGLILGDQTSSREWQARLREAFPELPLAVVDERRSSEQARLRYWDLYPAQGLTRLVPRSLRTPPRAYDDVVAFILVERYLKGHMNNCKERG